MAWTQSEIDICEEALALLRQDVDLPTPETADEDNTLEWKKCRNAYPNAREEVLSAHDWVFARDPAARTDLKKWPSDVKNCLIYVLARRLAVPIAGRLGDLQTYDALYQDALIRARFADLTREYEDDPDPILAELIQNFIGDPAKMINTYTIYSTRSSAVKLESDREVMKVLGIKTLDDLAAAASTALSVSKLSAACGLDANFKQLKLQEYQSKIQEWRRLKLNEALASNEDPVLAEILANFRSDDAALSNAFDVYTKRSEMVKAVAVQEINIAHEWTTPFDGTDKTHIAYPAYLALCAAKLVVSCGLTGDAAKLYEARYQVNLHASRVKDLEDAPVEDPIAKDVLALIRGNFSEDAVLPRSIKKLTDKIDALKDMARKDVLSSHDWNFARAEADFDPVEVTLLPVDCLIVSAVYGLNGRLAQWKVVGKEIRSTKPICRVSYIRDIEDFSEWTPKAYRAFILRLVADVTKAIAANPKDRQYQETMARDALEDAKACDARDANTPDDAWGPNEIAETMLYGGSDDPLDRS